MKFFNCSANNYSFEEFRALHSIPSVKEEEKEHMHAQFGDVARLYHSSYIMLHLLNQGNVHESFILFKSEEKKVKAYRCFGKYP